MALISGSGFRSIDRAFLQQFLAQVKTEAHHLYALMDGLPKENFYIFRFYDVSLGRESWDDDMNQAFTLREFFDRCGELNPDDDLGFYFVANPRTDFRPGYDNRICLTGRCQANIPILRRRVEEFLTDYCEVCLRENNPFVLTPGVIARFGFTSRDVILLNRSLNRYNAAAKGKIRAEYDAMRVLDFLSETKK